MSSEFQPDFDREIAELRKELDSDDLRDFKSSDGKLSPSLSAERLHELRGVKAKILEMIWAYLYSGREQKAWELLAEMARGRSQPDSCGNSECTCSWHKGPG